jgi:hypothetical protein
VVVQKLPQTGAFLLECRRMCSLLFTPAAARLLHKHCSLALFKDFSTLDQLVLVRIQVRQQHEIRPKGAKRQKARRPSCIPSSFCTVNTCIFRIIEFSPVEGLHL